MARDSLSLALSQREREDAAPSLVAPSLSVPIVAYAANPASGELSLMVGTSETVVHDPDLVARLHQLAAGPR